MWAGLNGFDPRTDLVLGCVRIGKDCMNIVTVISEYTQVPVTLSTETRENQPESTNQTFEDASAE